MKPPAQTTWYQSPEWYAGFDLSDNQLLYMVFLNYQVLKIPETFYQFLHGQSFPLYGCGLAPSDDPHFCDMRASNLDIEPPAQMTWYWSPKWYSALTFQVTSFSLWHFKIQGLITPIHFVKLNALGMHYGHIAWNECSKLDKIIDGVKNIHIAEM